MADPSGLAGRQAFDAFVDEFACIVEELYDEVALIAAEGLEQRYPSIPALPLVGLSIIGGMPCPNAYPCPAVGGDMESVTLAPHLQSPGQCGDTS
jgi:hypothetical protein